MTIMFLCGAGASKFGGPCFPCAPPLGSGGELFRELRARGGVAATITGEMAIEFERDFEGGMAMFMREREPDVTALLRDMAFYFLRFRPEPGQYYRELIRACREAGVEPIFATTNYELLIEYSIMSEGYGIHLGEEPRPPNPIMLLKVHGSSNFVVTPPRGHVMQNVSAVGTRVYFSGMEVTPHWPEQAIPLLFQHRDFAPSMSVYAAGKRVLFSGSASFDWVECAQRLFPARLAAASRAYVIGLRVNPQDAHIWGPLAASSGWLGYVGKEPDEFTSWAERAARRNAHVVASTFEEAMRIIPGQLRQNR